jgi:caspase domain-containing protein
VILRPITAALALLGVLWQGRASADERQYALIIGYNGPPSGERTDAPPPLRFADDDAMAFYELQREAGNEAILLVLPDSDTRSSYPDSVDAAQAPTLEALDRAMAHLKAEMQADSRAGRTPVFFFFYSGHGVHGVDGQAALTLLDGSLSRKMLYEHVLDQAPADVVHLLVDACYAEAIVSPRDGDAKVVPLSPSDVAAYLSQSTLARYPRVGMAIASSSDGTAHEWDLYQSGVFTHELISALRGAADVNGDRRIEYSELDAFLAAANREVQDPRARLRAIVKAPVDAPRAAMADLSRGQGVARLTKIPAASEAFSVEDTRGNRLADGRPELGFSMSLSLPANQRLFVRRGDREAELLLRPGTDSEFGALVFRERPLRARGAVESALRAGLFLTPFGPAYYRGYVDREDVAAVPVAPALGLFADARAGGPPTRRKSAVSSLLGGAGAALLTSSALFAGLAGSAWHDNQNAVERDSADAVSRFRLDTALTAGFLLSGAACLTAALLVGSDP